jgi:DNA-binding MarR family transcriptional regulator
MENNVTIKRERQLFLLLRQTYTLIYQAIEDDLRESGCVPYTQASVLFVLKAIGEPATPTEMSRWLLREKHTVSELISRMEKQGLVRKTKGLKRKNLVGVTLTDKGEEALRQGMMKEKTIRKIMSCLSNEEQDSLRGHLEKLRSKALEEPRIRYRLPLP